MGLQHYARAKVYRLFLPVVCKSFMQKVNINQRTWLNIHKQLVESARPATVC
jgi:hypothetical protein